MTAAGVRLPVAPVALHHRPISLRPSRRVLSAALVVAPIIVGALVLIGWVVGSTFLKDALIGPIPVRPNAAAAVVLLGVALLVSGLGKPAWPVGLAGALYALAGLIAGLTIVEYAFHVDLGIDALIFKASPDLTAPFPDRLPLSAAVGLLLLASAGALSIVGWSSRATIAAITGAATLGGMALLEHLYGAGDATTGWTAATSMAIPTAISMLLLAAALLASPRVRGIHEVLGSRSAGGTIARVLLITSLLLLPTLGVLRQLGENAGLFGPSFGLSVMVAVSVACLSTAGVVLGQRLESADLSRRAAENQFLRVIELADDAICVIGRDGYFRNLNPAWGRLLGYDTEEFKSRPFIDFVHPDDREHTLAEWADTVSQGKITVGFANRYRHHDGTYRTLEWAAQISHESSDVYAVARDISARREVERERAFMAAIVNSTDEAVISTDLEGGILSWNRGATKLFGYSAAEMLGVDVGRLIPPDRDHERATRVAQIAAGVSVEDWETIRVAKGGRLVPVMLTLSGLRDANGVLIGSAVIERDISAIKAARERVESANAELAGRNAELRDFASVVSHDLRAPLRRLQMFADMAVAAPGTDAEVTDLLQRIRSSADRMEALVIDLLTYARLGSAGTTMRPVDLAAIVAEALEEMQTTLAERHTLVDIGDLPSVDGDPILLRQLFTNLLGNAVKFARPGVKPVISIEASVLPSSLVEIRVKDNGIGFDPSFRDRIFRIFERLATDTPGTGIGLAICRKITDLHGGTIEAASTPGDGATFIVRLPISHAKEL